MITPIDEYLATAELSDTALSNYFGKMPRYRGRFFVQMKAVVAHELRKKGYTLQRISEIIIGRKNGHDVVLHWLKKHKEQPGKDYIRNNYKTWIREGIYPKSERLITKEKDPYCLPNEVAYLRVSSTNLKLEKL
jgi:hypothetical protein